MAKIENLWDIVEGNALSFPDKTAFINKDGSSFGFSQLRIHSLFLASELITLGMYGRGACILGEVNYSSVAAFFGCAAAGVPVIIPDMGSCGEEMEKFLVSYDVGCVFYSAKYTERCEALAEKMPGVLMFPEVEKLLNEVPLNIGGSFPEIPPESPACMFFTSKEKKPVILSHKNICASLSGVAENLDISSYSFLTPPIWSGAFNCVMGLLLPLYCGCSLVKRGEKRSVARAIYESGATALTCTPDRLLSLEKSLKIKYEKKRGKLSIAVSDFFGKLLSRLGPGAGEKIHRKIHALMGDNLKLIICGGGFPDRKNMMRFISWGFKVYNCYFLTELGPAAISDSDPMALKLLPPYRAVPPLTAQAGKPFELVIETENPPLGYYGLDTDFSQGFKTGDMCLIGDDETVTILGKRHSMLVCGRGDPVFPEDISAALCRSRYISKCAVSGRFDTRTADIFVTAVIYPDYKEISSVLGARYSENRLRLFISREINRFSDELPHKINEFKLSERKSQNTNERK